VALSAAVGVNDLMGVSSILHVRRATLSHCCAAQEIEMHIMDTKYASGLLMRGCFRVPRAEQADSGGFGNPAVLVSDAGAQKCHI